MENQLKALRQEFERAVPTTATTGIGGAIQGAMWSQQTHGLGGAVKEALDRAEEALKAAQQGRLEQLKDYQESLEAANFALQRYRDLEKEFHSLRDGIGRGQYFLERGISGGQMQVIIGQDGKIDGIRAMVAGSGDLAIRRANMTGALGTLVDFLGIGPVLLLIGFVFKAMLAASLAIGSAVSKDPEAKQALWYQAAALLGFNKSQMRVAIAAASCGFDAKVDGQGNVKLSKKGPDGKEVPLDANDVGKIWEAMNNGRASTLLDSVILNTMQGVRLNRLNLEDIQKRLDEASQQDAVSIGSRPTPKKPSAPTPEDLRKDEALEALKDPNTKIKVKGKDWVIEKDGMPVAKFDPRSIKKEGDPVEAPADFNNNDKGVVGDNLFWAVSSGPSPAVQFYRPSPSSSTSTAGQLCIPGADGHINTWLSNEIENGRLTLSVAPEDAAAPSGEEVAGEIARLREESDRISGRIARLESVRPVVDP